MTDRSNSKSEKFSLSQIETPCIKVCSINPQTRLCEGCGRTLDQIATWSTYTHEERQAIMQELVDRKTLVRKI